MKLVNRIVQDIQRGENLDLYLTIPAAFIVGLINLTGLIRPEFVASITLIVLGAVATTILGNRYRVVQLAESKKGAGARHFTKRIIARHVISV